MTRDVSGTPPGSPPGTSPIADVAARSDERGPDLFTRTTLPQALTDPGGRFVMANTAYCDLVGVSSVELFGSAGDAITHPADLPGQRRAVDDLLAGRRTTVELSKRYLRPDGTVLRCQLVMGVVRDATGAVRYLHGAVTQVDLAAAGDPVRERDRPVVTPVAAAAREQLARLLTAPPAGHVLQVALLRLDGLEHLAGVIGWPMVGLAHTQVVDRLAATRGLGIRAVVPIGVTDLLVIADSPHPGAVPAVLHSALRQPLALAGVRLPVSARVGLTTAETGHDPDRVLRQARVALNEALRTGAPEVRYAPALDARALVEFALTSEIAAALTSGEFALHYQPKYRLDTSELSGVEALLRWTHPERGPVPPDRVVRLAESAGLIAPLTCWVIDTAAAQAAAWRDAGTPIPVAVNVSPVMLANPILPLWLSEAVTRHRLGPGSLEVEITETALSSEPQAVTAVQQLAGLGYPVSIDDFGTGYSSLAALKNLPLHAIKIDRAFVRDLAEDSRDQAIVTAVVEIAHRLGSRVVAEGVEDAATLESLRELGCDEAQGYHLGAPVTADRIPPPMRSATDHPVDPDLEYPREGGSGAARRRAPSGKPRKTS